MESLQEKSGGTAFNSLTVASLEGKLTDNTEADKDGCRTYISFLQSV
jgi:hypothetical protein